MKTTLKWTAITVGAVLVAAAAYIVFNTFDCEPPDISKFANSFEMPSEADNVYCGLAATTNVVSGKTGLPVLTSVFDKYADAWNKFNHPSKDMSAEEKDAILAEAEKVLSLFHEAARRKTWCAVDPLGKRDPFPALGTFIRLCRLADLQARRHLELGKTGAAIEGVRDMILLTRKIEQDAESAVRWLAAGGALYYADGTALRIISSGKATDEELLRLQDALRQFDLASRSERVERMMNNDFTIFFTRMADRKTLLAPENSELAPKMLRVPILGFYAYHHNRTWTTYARYVEKMKEGYRLGYDRAAWSKIEDDLRILLESSSPWRFGPNFAGKKLLAGGVPAWSGIGTHIMRANFQHSSAETIVAAARFKRKTGSFPKNLAELVPEYLSAVPRDPFAQNAEIKYDAARGIIWTVGPDGTFDGETATPDAGGKHGGKGKYGKNSRSVFNISGVPAE